MCQIIEVVCAILALCGRCSLTNLAWCVIICELIRFFIQLIVKIIEIMQER